MRAEHVRVAHRAAHDAAQDVSAPLVGGEHAVRHQEAGRAQVVGDHLERRVQLAVCIARFDADRILRRADQAAEEVDLVVVVDALEDRRDALQAHAGVDRRARQVEPLARELLVLHEDEVPDLDEPVAVFLRRARGAAPDMVAVVEEDLRARAAGTGVAHAPEVVVGRDPDDLLVRQTGDFLPQLERFVVVGVDGRQEPVGGKAELLGDQGPRELDRTVLEIVAEREVAEHLEEGVVAGGVADVLQVVVLAAGAHAFLRRHRAVVGAVLGAGEDVLELDHAGVGEQQRRVVARHEGRGCDDLVPRLPEIIQKFRADLVDAAHE